MFSDKKVLAVVPARSGSKGIPNKNMQLLDGVTLIGRAGQTLAKLPWIDASILSTDSKEYQAEGLRYGLQCPFIRPSELSNDNAGAIETLQHAILECERFYNARYNIVLIVEPTSPLRRPQDIEACVKKLVENQADSVVTVSILPEKSHPKKILIKNGDNLTFYSEIGAKIVGRQELDGEYYFKNGICYALTRDCLMEKCKIFTDRTLAEVITRPVVNIDEPLELEWAAFLLQREKNNPTQASGGSR